MRQRLSLLLAGLFVVLTMQAQDVVRAWRGERIGISTSICSKDSIAEPIILGIQTDKALQVEAGPLRGVLTDDFKSCGQHPMDWTTWMAYDIIDAGGQIQLQQGKEQPVWLSAEVARNAKKGTHKIKVLAYGATTGHVYQTLNFKVQVIGRTLPEPHDYTFHLNFWQQPYSVSRYYGVERWSAQHFELLRPYMQRLARGGQKVVSAILFYEPWGDQSNDKFSPMVQTTLRDDSTWAYDYSIFDKWVEFMASCGIDQQIDCYSMIPWEMSFRYWDEAKGSYQYLQTTTSAPEYKTLWTAFLQSFAQHLREKGWFDKTCIAMDERGMDDMLRAYKIAQDAVPGLRLSLAGNHHPELAPLLQDYSLAYGQTFTPEERAKQRAEGRTCTMYTCCTEVTPNILTNSAPQEATYIPLYCEAMGFDGYLHWSWLNWNDDPLHDSRFRLFSSGDTYVVYPDNHSSVRWERFVEGVQQVEKIHILRQQGDSTLNHQLDAALAPFTNGDASDPAQVLRQIQTLERVVNK